MNAVAKIKLAGDIVAIVENYDSWGDLDSHKDEVWEEITRRLNDYGVELA
jgi:hypothetical protein